MESKNQFCKDTKRGVKRFCKDMSMKSIKCEIP